MVDRGTRQWRRGCRAALVLVAIMVTGAVPARAQAGATLIPYDMLPVGPGGSPVFVGTAEPGATVDLLDGATVIATGVANYRGEWFLAPTTALPPGPHEFTVRATPAVVATDPVSHPPLAPASIPPPAVTPFTATLDQAAVPAVIGGTAAPGATVAVILDGGPGTIEVRADAEGAWTVPVPPLAAGAYPVRATELDPAGAPPATVDLLRVERLAAGALRAVVTIASPPATEAAGTLAGPRLVTVGRNDTLWDIAVRAYGDGTRYREIYDANRDQLSNPRRIFAGQVLLIP